MENIKSPAYPHISYEANGQNGTGMYTSEDGFSKLEKAALTIAAGMVASNNYVVTMHSEHPHMAITAVSFAKAILEECNK